jgi:hypothetical protein
VDWNYFSQSFLTGSVPDSYQLDGDFSVCFVEFSVPFSDNVNQSSHAWDLPPLAQTSDLDIFGSACSVYVRRESAVMARVNPRTAGFVTAMSADCHFLVIRSGD